jgi:hypothetical protein
MPMSFDPASAGEIMNVVRVIHKGARTDDPEWAWQLAAAVAEARAGIHGGWKLTAAVHATVWAVERTGINSLQRLTPAPDRNGATVFPRVNNQDFPQRVVDEIVRAVGARGSEAVRQACVKLGVMPTPQETPGMT